MDEYLKLLSKISTSKNNIDNKIYEIVKVNEYNEMIENFNESCKKINRTIDDFYDYYRFKYPRGNFYYTITKNKKNGKIKVLSKFDNNFYDLLFNYIKNYVYCDQCQLFDTILIKSDNKNINVRCNNCNNIKEIYDTIHIPQFRNWG